MWAASSRTKDVLAPCGFELFTGSRDTYDKTIASEVDKGLTLEYRARFVSQTSPDGESYTAADRELVPIEHEVEVVRARSRPRQVPGAGSCTSARPDATSPVNSFSFPTQQSLYLFIDV